MKPFYYCIFIIFFLAGCAGKTITLNEKLMALTESGPVNGNVIVIDDSIEKKVAIVDYRSFQTAAGIKIQIKMFNLRQNEIHVDQKIRFYSNGMKVDNVNESWKPIIIERNDYSVIEFAFPDNVDFFELLLKEGERND